MSFSIFLIPPVPPLLLASARLHNQGRVVSDGQKAKENVHSSSVLNF